MMLNQMSSQKQVQEMADQLRREANIKRMNASQAIADLQHYVEENAQSDCLLVGFSSQKANPYREKSSCDLL